MGNWRSCCCCLPTAERLVDESYSKDHDFCASLCEATTLCSTDLHTRSTQFRNEPTTYEPKATQQIIILLKQHRVWAWATIKRVFEAAARHGTRRHREQRVTLACKPKEIDLQEDEPENLPVRNAATMARILNSATSKQATPRGPRLCGDKPLTAALAEATADSGQPSQPSVLLFQKSRKKIALSAVERRGIVADGRWRCVFYKWWCEWHDWCLIHMLADKKCAATRAEGGES